MSEAPADARRVAPGRIPCLNPRCRRTAAADGVTVEIICRKCWRTLPKALRDKVRAAESHYKLLERHIGRRMVLGEIAPDVADRLLRSAHGRLSLVWQTIRLRFQEPAMPEGLENFLEQMGLTPDPAGSPG